MWEGYDLTRGALLHSSVQQYGIFQSNAQNVPFPFPSLKRWEREDRGERERDGVIIRYVKRFRGWID